MFLVRHALHRADLADVWGSVTFGTRLWSEGKVNCPCKSSPFDGILISMRGKPRGLVWGRVVPTAKPSSQFPLKFRCHREIEMSPFESDTSDPFKGGSGRKASPVGA